MQSTTSQPDAVRPESTSDPLLIAEERWERIARRYHRLNDELAACERLIRDLGAQLHATTRDLDRAERAYARARR